MVVDNIANETIFMQGQKWCSSNKRTYEGKRHECLTFQCRFKQAISDPTQVAESTHYL